VSTKNSNSEVAPADTEVKIPCEVYSRIVGYLRPVQNWHQGKQQEFRERKTFQVTKQSPLRESPRET
jgi:anaerobic ribonucleoside-triphosphate reductase